MPDWKDEGEGKADLRCGEIKRRRSLSLSPLSGKERVWPSQQTREQRLGGGGDNGRRKKQVKRKNNPPRTMPWGLKSKHVAAKKWDEGNRFGTRKKSNSKKMDKRIGGPNTIRKRTEVLSSNNHVEEETRTPGHWGRVPPTGWGLFS